MCPKLQTTCLHNRVILNGKKYDLYMGYLSSKKILEISSVPSFSTTKSNVDIAKGIPPHTDPVEDWQRPLDDKKTGAKDSKVTSIAKIYASKSHDNLMPNPIIISTNPLLSSDGDVDIELSKFYAPGTSPPVEIPEMIDIKFTYTDSKKPLWLLDGQHRTVGMSRTGSVPGGEDRSDIPIPFILLHGDNYHPSELAKIFTHVTSGATEMDPIHKEWMHYSFELPKYDIEHNRKAMEAVTYLCLRSEFGIPADGKIQNPFYDKIKFNPKLDSNGFFAFNFNSIQLSSFFSSLYYKGNSRPLEPEDLAEQIAYSVRAFYELDTHRNGAPDPKSRLFDNGAQQLTRLAEAYIKSILKFLKQDKISGMKFNEWKEFLSDSLRQFQNNDWRLIWVGGLDGATGNSSVKLAERVFLKYLRADLTKVPTHTIVECLEGAGAGLNLVAVYWDDSKNRKIENMSKPAYKSPTPYALGASKLTFSLTNGGHSRTAFRVEVPKDFVNIDIIGVYDAEKMPTPKLPDAQQKKSHNCKDELQRTPPGLKGEFKIIVQTRAFSGGTVVDTEIKIKG